MPLSERLQKKVDTKIGFLSTVVDKKEGRTANGQPYVALITKAIVYKLSVLLDNEWIASEFASEHVTRSGVDEKLRDIEEMLQRVDSTAGHLAVWERIRLQEHGELSYVQAHDDPIYPQARDENNLDGSDNLSIGLTRRVTLPDWTLSNVDSMIEPGDLLMTPFVGVFQHAGIYLGKGKVSHVSGHGGPKENARARIGELVPHFVHKENDTIYVIRPRVWHNHAATVCRAEEYAQRDFRRGEYNLLLKNCQHYAFLCAFGYETSELRPDLWQLLVELIV